MNKTIDDMDDDDNDDNKNSFGTLTTFIRKLTD